MARLLVGFLVHLARLRQVPQLLLVPVDVVLRRRLHVGQQRLRCRGRSLAGRLYGDLCCAELKHARCALAAHIPQLGFEPPARLLLLARGPLRQAQVALGLLGARHRLGQPLSSTLFVRLSPLLALSLRLQRRGGLPLKPLRLLPQALHFGTLSTLSLVPGQRETRLQLALELAHATDLRLELASNPSVFALEQQHQPLLRVGCSPCLLRVHRVHRVHHLRRLRRLCRVCRVCRLRSCRSQRRWRRLQPIGRTGRTGRTGRAGIVVDAHSCGVLPQFAQDAPAHGDRVEAPLDDQSTADQARSPHDSHLRVPRRHSPLCIHHAPGCRVLSKGAQLPVRGAQVVVEVSAVDDEQVALQLQCLLHDTLHSPRRRGGLDSARSAANFDAPSAEQVRQLRTRPFVDAALQSAQIADGHRAHLKRRARCRRGRGDRSKGWRGAQRPHAQRALGGVCADRVQLVEKGASEGDARVKRREGRSPRLHALPNESRVLGQCVEVDTPVSPTLRQARLKLAERLCAAHRHARCRRRRALRFA